MWYMTAKFVILFPLFGGHQGEWPVEHFTVERGFETQAECMLKAYEFMTQFVIPGEDEGQLKRGESMAWCEQR